jgi:hypothetical protein
MKKYLKRIKQSAGYSAVESGYHYKNGASLKSLTSRRNKLTAPFTLFVFILLLYGCRFSPDRKLTAAQTNGLHGKVQSVSEKTYKISEIDSLGQIIKGDALWAFVNASDDCPSSLRIYDIKGNITFEYCPADTTGMHTKCKSIFTNDKKGNITKEKLYLIIYVTDEVEKGIIRTFEGAETQHVIKYEYQQKGDYLTVKKSDKFSYIELIINKEGYVEEKCVFSNSDGGIDYKLNYKYDKDGNVVERKYWQRGDNSYAGTITFKAAKFDSQNNWVERIGYEDGNAVIITERKIKYY